MNKRFLTAACAALAVVTAAPTFAAPAPTPSACGDQGLYVGFYNGVWSTSADALRGMGALRAQLGETYRGEHIRYELMYNPTNGWEGIVQAFDQRLAQENAVLTNRWESFWDTLQGRGPGGAGFLATLGQTFSSMASLANDLRAIVTTASVNSVTSLAANPPTARDYAEQNTRLDTMTLEGRKLLLVAHSQGDLFLGQAYQHLDAGVAAGRVTAGSYAALRIAPAGSYAPARSQHVLVSQDQVINALRQAANVPANNATVPTYQEQIALGVSDPDISADLLAETYLNAMFTGAGAPAPMIKSAAYQLIDGLTTPSQLARSGFFTATLNWDRNGDVDLHAFEPNGAHVFYGMPNGQSGMLDYDDTRTTGPEHYTTTCDASQLAEGTYTIAVNNFGAPAGTQAVVQVATWADGPLLTAPVLTLGQQAGSAGNANPTPVMTVTVAKDPATGLFKVTAAAANGDGPVTGTPQTLQLEVQMVPPAGKEALCGTASAYQIRDFTSDLGGQSWNCTPTTWNMRLTNTTSSTMAIGSFAKSSIAWTTASNSCGATLAAGESCVVAIKSPTFTASESSGMNVSWPTVGIQKYVYIY